MSSHLLYISTVLTIGWICNQCASYYISYTSVKLYEELMRIRSCDTMALWDFQYKILKSVNYGSVIINIPFMIINLFMFCYTCRFFNDFGIKIKRLCNGIKFLIGISLLICGTPLIIASIFEYGAMDTINASTMNLVGNILFLVANLIIIQHGVEYEKYKNSVAGITEGIISIIPSVMSPPPPPPLLEAKSGIADFLSMPNTPQGSHNGSILFTHS